MTLVKKWLQKLNAGYCLAFLLLLLCFLLTITFSTRLARQTSSISDTDSTLVRLNKVLDNLKGEQVAWGQYIITNNKNNIQKYYDARYEIDSLLGVMHQFSSFTPVQRKSLDTLHSLFNYIFPEDQKPVNIYNSKNKRLIDSLREMNIRNTVLTDSVSNLILRIQSREMNKIKNKKEALISLSGLLKIISYITLFIALALGIYMLIIFGKERRAKKKANQQADEYHKQLEFRIDELTEMNKEMARLKSLERFSSMGRIAATFAHEIKNPLTNIDLASNELSKINGEDNDGTVFIEIIGRNSTKINRLISDFLKVTAFSKLYLKNRSINELIEEILQESMDRILLEGITVKKDFSTDICDVAIDAKKIKVAFQNIIFNAIEAMEPGKGVLRIRTEGRADKCVILIEDNGVGMDEDTLSKIFEPYYTNKPKKGSGLGLAQSQNIIFNHEGSIEVESTLNKGTRFIISLNFAKED